MLLLMQTWMYASYWTNIFCDRPDKISNEMLKMSPKKIAKPFLIIFNKSLHHTKYPYNW